MKTDDAHCPLQLKSKHHEQFQMAVTHIQLKSSGKLNVFRPYRQIVSSHKLYNFNLNENKDNCENS
jgi:hypothetical protein